MLIAYSSGDDPSGTLIERIKARRPDVNPADLFPVGLDATRVLIERYVAGGFSKFVLIPSAPTNDMTGELEAVAAQILPMEN